jgi:hypothetical protein
VILKKLTEKSDHSDEYNSIEKFDLGPAIKSQAGVKDRSYAFSDVPSGAPVTFEVQATSAGGKKGASSKPARSAPFTVKRGCSEAAAPVAPESVSFHSLDGSDKVRPRPARCVLAAPNATRTAGRCWPLPCTKGASVQRAPGAGCGQVARRKFSHDHLCS